jgi:O-antigen/teichoic acid export membrane protein
MTDEGSGARVVRNTLVNGLGTFVGVVITLLLTPFLIDGVGVEGFGVWALALSISFLGGYASLADLGIEGAAARYIAEARSDGDVDEMNRTASSAMAFFCTVALLLTPPLVLLAAPLVDAFGIEGDLRDEAVLCFAFVAGQLLFELPTRVFYAVLEGTQRFTYYQGVELTRALSQTALFIGVLVADLGVAGLGAAMMASSLVVLVLSWILAHRAVPELRLRPGHVTRPSVRRLVHFGSGLLFIRLTGVIYRQMDKAIVGVALGARSVTFYEIANRIHAGAAMVQSISTSALLPATAYSRARLEVLRELYLRGSMYTVALALPVTAAAFILAEPLIRTWVGEDFVSAAGPTRLFLVYLLFVAVHAVGATMIVALGRLRFVSAVVLANLVTNFAVSVALVGPLGVEGVILGTLIGQGLAWIPLLWYFRREFRVGLGEWARRIVLPNLPGLAVQAATAVPLLELADHAGNLAAVGLLMLLSSALSIVTFVAVGLGSEQRATLISTMRRAVKTGA